MAPSAAQLEQRRIIGIESERVTNIQSTDFPGHYPGEDHSWNLEAFKKNLKIKFHKYDPYDIEFDLIGVDASIANAFRRILIAEVPTLAIEKVFVAKNTSIIQDEVLAQRLGLVPLVGAKQGLKTMRWTHAHEGPIADPTDYNTVVMTLKAECKFNPDASKTATDPKELYVNSSVYSSQITYEPQGRQPNWFPDGVKAVNPNILIAKMRPGQEIDVQMHCVLGIGQDHAKFSPVATASYRLMPTITITKPITGQDAINFARCFPRGVIRLEDDKESGAKKAVVAEPRKDTVSREVLRHEEFKGKIKLGRIRDHFIFSVESTGAFESDELMVQAIHVLRAKCQRFKKKLLED